MDVFIALTFLMAFVSLGVSIAIFAQVLRYDDQQRLLESRVDLTEERQSRDYHALRRDINGYFDDMTEMWVDVNNQVVRIANARKKKPAVKRAPKRK